MNLLCGCIPADASGSFFRFYGAMRGPSCVAPRYTEIKKEAKRIPPTRAVRHREFLPSPAAKSNIYTADICLVDRRFSHR